MFIVKEKDICLFTYNYLRTWPVQKLKSVGCEGQECGKCLRLRFPPAMRAKYSTLDLNFGWLVSIFKNVHCFRAPPSQHKFENLAHRTYPQNLTKSWFTSAESWNQNFLISFLGRIKVLLRHDV